MTGQFFKRRKTNVLSRSEEIGLFGELLFIRNQFEAGVQDADVWWNGPKNGSGFSNKKLAVEIKTTTATKSISGVGQLSLDDEYAGGNLYLIVYRL